MKYEIIKNNENIYLQTQEGKRVDIVTLIKESKKHVFCFEGPMGVGKTTLIKQICEEMNVVDYVNSPTFSIVNVYETQDRQEIYHIDLYRLKNMQEAMDIGIEDYLYSNQYCFIEWPNLIKDILPEDSVFWRLEEEDGKRFLTTI